MNTYLRLLYLECATRWQQSAVFWRAVAEEAYWAQDIARMEFAHYRAQQAELHAEEDRQKAEAFA